MKVALITDQHFGARNDSVHFLDYYEKFYKETFFPALEENNIKTVLILGDTFDRRKYINFYTLKRAREMFFDVLAEREIEVHMLAGNHDTYFKNTNNVNSVDLLLREYENINIIDEPQTISVQDEQFCMMPWICPENHDRSMEEINLTTAKYCMGHFEINGFVMHPGAVCEDGLPRSIFYKFNLTFSGHYHHKSYDDSIHYLGNPYELTWSDYMDTRGFHIFDTETEDLQFIQNPNRMFFKIHYDDKAESITEITQKNLSEYTNRYVKVVIDNKTNPFLFDRFMENLYNVNPLDVMIVEDFTEDEEEYEPVDEAEDTITILNKYIDNIKEENLDGIKLKGLIKNLYNEALNAEIT